MTKKRVTLEHYNGPTCPGVRLVHECVLDFSVIDHSFVDTPREESEKSFYTLTVWIERPLAINWRLVSPSSFFSPTAEERDALLRVMFFRATEHVRDSIRGATLQQCDELPLTRRTEEQDCPFVISRLPSPDDAAQRTFDVELNEQPDDTLAACLRDFVQHIESDMRMTFWRYSKARKRYHWTPSPEKTAKRLLRTFLKGQYRDGIDTFEEIAAGAGKIDIYVVFSNGERAVIELKMCGHRYSMDYAQSGVEQVVHYMRNRKTSTGFLIVFDSRMRDFGKGLHREAVFDGVSVPVLVTDLRPYVKQRDAPPDV